MIWGSKRFAQSCCVCLNITVKIPKNSGSIKICGNHPKIQTMWLYHRVIRPKDADGKANSVDPDQTAPRNVSFTSSVYL